MALKSVTALTREKAVKFTILGGTEEVYGVVVEVDWTRHELVLQSVLDMSLYVAPFDAGGTLHVTEDGPQDIEVASDADLAEYVEETGGFVLEGARPETLKTVTRALA